MLAKTLRCMMIGAWVWASPALACTPLTEPQKIGQLLEFIETSDMQFIRNGEAYAGNEARKHLEGKLDYAGDKITTAKQFIHYIATESSFTGEPYFVQFNDGTKIRSAEWLTGQLASIESKDCTTGERSADEPD